MRATSHNGRWGSVKHNGRGFDLSKAGHIDKARVGDNYYWSWDGESDFLGAEERYYCKRFGGALESQNERHRAARHPERVKAMSDWMQHRNTRPEETIWQIGDMSEDVEIEDFVGAVEDMQGWLMDWSKAHGEPFKILTNAVHLDEASPHAHIRRVWQYQDASGEWRIGQNKALEAAGVPLPDPSKPEGKYNNRKMSFDAMVREKWVEICQNYGYEIEREPDPKHQEHLSKEQIIDLHERESELQDRAVKLRSREVQANVREKQQKRREADLDSRERALEAQEQALSDKAREIQDITKQALQALYEADTMLQECDNYKRTIAEQQKARILQQQKAKTASRAEAAQAMLSRVGIAGSQVDDEYTR